MGILDFSTVSNITSSSTFSDFVEYTKSKMDEGTSHEEMIADPKVIKLGIDSSYLKIKLRCRYLPKLLAKYLESSPHLVQQVIERSEMDIVDFVNEKLVQYIQSLLDSGVYQIYFFLEGEPHLPKLCLAQRREKKKACIDRFQKHVETYVSELQSTDRSVDDEYDDGSSFEEEKVVSLKPREIKAIQTLAQQHSATSTETTAEREKMVTAIAELETRYPNRLFIVSSQHEAELDAAFFYHSGIISHVYSVDTDVLVYGVPQIITDITSTPRGPHEVKFKHFDGFTCNDLSFNDSWELVSIPVMLGCDYNKRIPGVGRVKVCTKINQVRIKQEQIYKFVKDGTEVKHPFADWIRAVNDALSTKEILDISIYRSVAHKSLKPGIVRNWAETIGFMVAQELKKELTVDNWNELNFAACFQGMMKARIMAKEYMTNEEKKAIALETINAYKTRGYPARYCISN